MIYNESSQIKANIICWYKMYNVTYHNRLYNPIPGYKRTFILSLHTFTIEYVMLQNVFPQNYEKFIVAYCCFITLTIKAFLFFLTSGWEWWDYYNNTAIAFTNAGTFTWVDYRYFPIVLKGGVPKLITFSALPSKLSNFEVNHSVIRPFVVPYIQSKILCSTIYALKLQNNVQTFTMKNFTYTMNNLSSSISCICITKSSVHLFNFGLT